jgi:cyanophycinase
MGPLVIIGGSLDPKNEPIYRAMLGLRVGADPICILPTASDRPEESMKSAVAHFERYGGPGSAIGIELFHTRAWKADRPKMARKLEGCGGFYFTDGEQSRIVDTLRPEGRGTLAEQAILRVHRKGGVISASSSGAAMMSERMIGSGSSDDALAHGIVEDATLPGVWIRGGMGLLRSGIADQAHLAKGRTGRLLVTLAGLDSVNRGFGIDEDTAFVIRGTVGRVVGSSQVVVFEKVRAGTGPRKLDNAGFRMLLLGNGDTYDLLDGSTEVEARKDSLRLDSPAPTPLSGPWLAAGLHLFVVDFAVSRGQSSEFTSRGYRFRLTKAEGFDARGWEIPTGDDVPHGFTAGWFELDITREPAPAGAAQPNP